MCLLFFNVNDDCNEDEFRLVLVNNRDEYWERPTKTSEFWSPSCISGLDQEPGREGGTWFGANRGSRVACLVNIASQQVPHKKGRGFLVTNFLKDSVPMETYANSIAEDSENYNGFILTLIELSPKGSKCMVVTNDKQSDKAALQQRLQPDDFHACGNSSPGKPWQKVTEGRQLFQKIVKDHRSLSDREKLTEKLFSFMHDRNRHIPDPVLEATGTACGWPPESIAARSAVFVWDPLKLYGTRTTTVLLVDKAGHCHYTEKTLATPVNTTASQWTTVHHTFTMQ